MSTTAKVARALMVIGIVLILACLGVGYMFAALPLGLLAAALPLIFVMGPGLLVSYFDKRSKSREKLIAQQAGLARVRAYGRRGDFSPQVPEVRQDAVDVMVLPSLDYDQLPPDSRHTPTNWWDRPAPRDL